jgi:hypothetical protein
MGTPAHAIVGGAEDGGSLARSSVMVLSSKGGVCTAVVVARTAALAAVEPYGPSRILVWAKGPAGVGVCQGDSGGPVTQGGSGAVFAVAAWAAGVNGAGCGGLSQGVLLGPQREWIDRILSGWGRSAAWR